MFFTMPATLDNGIKEFIYPQRVIFGREAINGLAELIKPVAKRVLIVTHAPGRFTSSGVIEFIQNKMNTLGVYNEKFSISNTPTTDLIDKGVKFARDHKIDLILCVGGGSVLDAGKLIAILATNLGPSEDYQLGNSTFKFKPLTVVAVPTTAGSGSEATAVSVIKNSSHGFIKSISNPMMVPQIVVLDPALIQAVPSLIAATTGLDAFTHALESFVSPKSTQISRANSLSAASLIYGSLARVVKGIPKEEDFSNLLVGSYLAGQALNAGVGAAHIFAQPITAVLGSSHGLALSFVLKEVIMYNEINCPNLYDDFISFLDIDSRLKNIKMSDLIVNLMNEIDLNVKLSEFSSDEAIPEILDQISLSTSHIWTNACSIDMCQLEAILKKSW
jgi:alcohol dehydrogenase class IV